MLFYTDVQTVLVSYCIVVDNSGESVKLEPAQTAAKTQCRDNSPPRVETVNLNFEEIE